MKNELNTELATAPRLRFVRGGFLEQPNYTFVLDLADEDKNPDIVFAWAIGSTSNSNTITLVKDGALIANGVGQQDRVGAAQLALLRADEAVKLVNKSQRQANLYGAVAYSDSFFPFPDAPEALINRGISAILSSSGSVNDKLTIELCQRKGVKLILLPDKEIRGFFGH
ncbi:MAG: hypothetical protein WDN09_00020 [bacterium]